MILERKKGKERKKDNNNYYFGDYKMKVKRQSIVTVNSLRYIIIINQLGVLKSLAKLTKHLCEKGTKKKLQSRQLV